MSNENNTFIEIFKATLEFFGKIAVPVAILIVVLIFQETITQTFEGLQLSKVETPLGNAHFDKIIDELVSAEPGSPEEQKVIRKIETREEIINDEIESGIRKEVPIQGKAVSEGSDLKAPEPAISWNRVLGISWVKPNDLLGRTYFLDINDEIYIWPIRLDVDSNRAMFVINTSSKSRNSGKIIAKNIWIDKGSNFDFDFGKTKYRLNLVDIRKAGSLPSNAAYISVDEKNDTI